jgi:hypothetical protein
VEINFNADGAISGAAIRTYLLERSRVVSVNNPERSYHIFYQVRGRAGGGGAAVPPWGRNAAVGVFLTAEWQLQDARRLPQQRMPGCRAHAGRARPSPAQLCDGASPEERKRWRLKPAQEYHYLNQSTCFEIPGDSNAEEYEVRPRSRWLLWKERLAPPSPRAACS